MFKVAVLGDIHANLHALETVLAHARGQGVDAVWNLGDFVGYGAYPDQVVRRIRLQAAVSIIGNYDLKVLRFPKKKGKWRRTKHPKKYDAFRWAYQHLSPASLDYLRSLPKEVRLTVGGFSVLLTHGSPASNEEPLFLTTEPGRMRELAALAATDIILCGHSHEPFKRAINGAWFINPGSVGRPGDGDPRASYAVMELQDRQLQVYLYRLPYDVDRAVTAQRESGFPESFAQMLIQGRSLDEIEAAA